MSDLGETSDALHSSSSPAGNVVYALQHSPSVTSSPNGFNPRSCVTCRRRKVKCDKRWPTCSNCSKAHSECAYPHPGRAPRRPRKPADNELLKRLAKLEGVVEELSAGGVEIPSLTEQDDSAKLKHQRPFPKQSALTPSSSNEEELEQRFGRLVIHEGKSRYLTPSFWASLADEVRIPYDLGVLGQRHLVDHGISLLIAATLG